MPPRQQVSFRKYNDAFLSFVRENKKQFIYVTFSTASTAIFFTTELTIMLFIRAGNAKASPHEYLDHWRSFY